FLRARNHGGIFECVVLKLLFQMFVAFFDDSLDALASLRFDRTAERLQGFLEPCHVLLGLAQMILESRSKFLIRGGLRQLWEHFGQTRLRIEQVAELIDDKSL